MKTPDYSDVIRCLYDEPGPVGNIGRGTHYSVFRSIESRIDFLDGVSKPFFHDFAVIWDEDHDTRIIETVEGIYKAGLLGRVIFIGERKGTLTVLLAHNHFLYDRPFTVEEYARDVELVAHSPGEDYWPFTYGFISKDFPPSTDALTSIIQTSESHARFYLKNIYNIWNLGSKTMELVSRIPEEFS
jgi:hypothetical protein